MRDPSAAELLDVWETGYSGSTEVASIALLELAWPESAELAMELPIGERDVRLFDVRARLFGPKLTSAVTCATCGESLELILDATELREIGAAPAATALTARLGDRSIGFRLPTTRDLLTIQQATDENEARRLLAERCIAPDAIDGGGEALSDELVEAVEAAMAAADPRADIELEASCPACGSLSRSVFDIAAYLRAELDAWARRTLHEVAVLAASFGWDEGDILAMSAWRRRYYVEAAAS